MKSNDRFYSTLSLAKSSVRNLFATPQSFHKVPQDWHVVIFDVKNSTGAVENKQHDLVNLTATGGIIAVLNLAHKSSIEIPFFFGGDGGTMMVPESLLPSVMSALEEHRKNTNENLGLELWLGSMRTADILSEGHELKIAKLQLGEKYVVPVVIGTGLKYAEQQVKKNFDQRQIYPSDAVSLDLQGMECKWDKIKPPPNTNEVVSLLVEARDKTMQMEVFKETVQLIDDVYGPLESRRPISLPKLELDTSFHKIKKELIATVGKANPLYLIRNWVFILIGRFYLRYNKKGQEYLQELIEFSDTLVIDGRINTVISGTASQREKLIHKLDKMEQKGEIIYGHHLSSDSIMSCYVRDRQNHHIHFVDGSDGGYTRAASQLKKKLRKSA